MKITRDDESPLVDVMLSKDSYQKLFKHFKIFEGSFTTEIKTFFMDKEYKIRNLSPEAALYTEAKTRTPGEINPSIEFKMSVKEGVVQRHWYGMIPIQYENMIHKGILCDSNVKAALADLGIYGPFRSLGTIDIRREKAVINNDWKAEVFLDSLSYPGGVEEHRLCVFSHSKNAEDSRNILFQILSEMGIPYISSIRRTRMFYGVMNM